MKEYIAPEIEIQKFTVEDIITASDDLKLGDTELPPV